VLQATPPWVHVGAAPQAHPPQHLPHRREGPPHQGGAQQAPLQGKQDPGHLSNGSLAPKCCWRDS
jgi:hypothetical protein